MTYYILHQWVQSASFPVGYLRLSGERSAPKNGAFLEFVAHSETNRRDRYTNCAPMLWSPMLWSPMNFVTWCHHKQQVS